MALHIVLAATMPPVDAPEALGFPIATLALLVAVAGFVASLCALGWQVLKHLLDGGRVKVYLNAAVWEPGFAVFTNRSGQFVIEASELNRGARREVLEVAQLVVENPGRTPVTVYSPGLAISGDGRRKHTLSPRLFDTGDGYGPDTSSMDSVVRLEPYDRVTFLLDYWSVLPGLLKDATAGQIVLRGHVGVAGRSDRPQKSSRRRAWKIGTDTITSRQGVDSLTPYLVLWRELFIRTPECEPASEAGARRFTITRGHVGPLLQRAMQQFDDQPSLDALMDAMEKEARAFGDENPLVQFGLVEGYESLERLKGCLRPWAESLPGRSPHTTSGSQSRRGPTPPTSTPPN